MDNNSFKTTELAYQPFKVLSLAPVTVVLDKASLNNNNLHIIANNSNYNRKGKSICSERSTQFSPRITISDLDSRCNTIDNQSDIDRFNNNTEEDDIYVDEDVNKKKQDLFPGFVEKSLLVFTKQSRLRFLCLRLITSPWFERISMLVILINCLTLGMYQPCNDNPCTSTRCRILEYFDHGIYAFFTVEMTIKIIAMGFIGKDTYLADTWNRLDMFIVIAGTVEYAIVTENLSLSAIRTIRVLRPLRAINRVPSMRILVMLLLDTLPMLGNVLLLCFFVFFIFGIIGVQLWKGVLRNRCFFDYNMSAISPYYDVKLFRYSYYIPNHGDSFICTKGGGMSTCNDLPPFINNSRICNGTIDLLKTDSSFNQTCINWNKYFTKCEASDKNPFKGAISFDNIGYAWVAIFQIISLESWVTIMYYIQDSHSFWNWIYFVFLIVIGSFFMINLCLVVIATQFSETKKRETERMIAERRRFSRSSSTIFSDGDPGSCWEELIKYVGHLFRKSRRHILEKYNTFKQKRIKEKEAKQNPSTLHRNDLHSNNFNCVNGDTQGAVTYEKLERKLEGKLKDALNTYAPRASPELSEIGDTALLTTNVNAALENKITTQSLVLEQRPGALKTVSLNCNNLTKKCEVIPNKRSTESHHITLSNTSHLGNNSMNGTKKRDLSVNFNSDDNDVENEILNINNKMATKSFIKPKAKLNLKKVKLKTLEDENKIKHCNCWNIFRKKIKTFVNTKFFVRGILGAILINTLSMGVEHHNQPETLTEIVEYSNYIFTTIFFLEMILKLIGDGIFDYIKNAFNVFDTGIVCISVYELIKNFGQTNTNHSSGVSVLRTFRLLRILKLVRFMPALRRQLVVMLKTIDNVATFFSLLVLFMFIFSILGMNIFGCKFCIINDSGVRLCERKNFDTLLWSIITVFQVLTQEDWNEVLYNGMEKTSSWAALYFIALMTFGNYVLFNLLVAILVEGFSTEDESKDVSKNLNKLNEEFEKDSLHIDHSFSNMNDPKNNKDKDKMLCIPEISFNTIISDELYAKSIHKSSSFTSNNNESLPSHIKFKQPPLITHTGPTPIQTPSSSSFNSLSLSQNDSKFINKMLFKRRLSLDSASFRSNLKSNLNVKIRDSYCDIMNNNCKKNASSNQFYFKPSHSTAHLNVKHSSFKHNHSSSLKIKNERKSILINSNRKPKGDAALKISSESEKILKDNLNFIPDSKNRPNVPSKNNLFNNSIMTFDNVYKDVDLVKNNEIESPSMLNFKALDTFPNSTSSLNHIYIQRSIVNKSGEKRSVINIKNDIDQYIFERQPTSLKKLILTKLKRPLNYMKERNDYSLFIFSKSNKIRIFFHYIIVQKWFDYTVLLFIALNCITLAMERPSIPPHSLERKFLTQSNYCFTFIFAMEMLAKVFAKGFFIGEHAYMKSGWNVMDGSLVIVSLIDAIITLTARSSPKIFGILRVFRLLRTLRPLRVISRAPGLKLVVQTLLSSLRPIGNIVLICCTFFIIFGILGVQLFKGKFYRCIGENVVEENIRTKMDCLKNDKNQWINPQYNFDNLGSALMALFVLSSKDGWVQIMYTGIDAVGVDKQPIENHNEWMLLYFISFLLLVGFFVLNMFVGVVVENFHKCREEQDREEKARRAAKRAKKFEEKRIKMKEIPYYANYSAFRRLIHDICNSKYFDLVIAGVIGLNVVTMSLEFYMMPEALDEVLDIFNYVFTFIFLIEAIMRLMALGTYRYIKERWNQLDIFIVILSLIGIVFDKLESRNTIPVNPTIIRVMRVLRIARVLKLLKMAKGIRSLLDTVIQALPQVGNLGLLFFLLFFIFAILGVELFGKLSCESINTLCDGLSNHAHFHNFGMSFLTLFRIATGDNWNGIMKDTLRENVLCQDESSPNSNSMCLASILAPIYFVIFVLMAQFVLVNVVVAVLMKHLDDSNKMMADDAEMDEEIEKQLEAEARNNVDIDQAMKMDENLESFFRPLTKQTSLPPNFTFNLPAKTFDLKFGINNSIESKKELLRAYSVKIPPKTNKFNKQNSFQETVSIDQSYNDEIANNNKKQKVLIELDALINSNMDDNNYEMVNKNKSKYLQADVPRPSFKRRKTKNLNNDSLTRV